MIRSARKADLYAFLLRTHPDAVERQGGSLRLCSNHSISIRRGYTGYRDFATGETGNSIDFLIRCLGCTFPEAVTSLCGESSAPGSRTSVPANKFSLPPKADSTSIVRSYLAGRGLPAELVDTLIKRGLLYQSRVKNNAVFLSLKKDFAEIRGTIPGRVFHSARKRSPDGFWGFRSRPDVKPARAYICEGAIDALSLYTIHCMDSHDDPAHVYCAIAGAANQKAIDRISSFLPVVMAVDNDDAGALCRQKNRKHPAVIPVEKDWNEDLVSRLRSTPPAVHEPRQLTMFG